MMKELVKIQKKKDFETRLVHLDKLIFHSNNEKTLSKLLSQLNPIKKKKFLSIKSKSLIFNFHSFQDLNSERNAASLH